MTVFGNFDIYNKLDMKRLILLLAVFCGSGTSMAQHYNLGVGLRAGVTGFLGDIGGGDLARGFVMNMQMSETRWLVGPHVNYKFNPFFAVSGGINYFRLGGEDAKCENIQRKSRNLNFKNDAFDFTVRLEYYPQFLSVSDVGYRGIYQLDYHTYFLLGVGTVLSNPKAQLNNTGKWYKLRKMQTEGVKYSPFALTVPMGAGFHFNYKRYHRFGFELTWNWTFTDYLDDISNRYVYDAQMSGDPMAPLLANQYAPQYGGPAAEQFGPGSVRGDPKDWDNYILVSVSYSRLFRTKNSFYRRNYSWMYGRKQKWGGTKAKF
jgi:hypothetical protein